jgi:hypothetical protein
MREAIYRIQKMSDTMWVKKSRVSAFARQRDDIPSCLYYARYVSSAFTIDDENTVA